MGTLNDIPTQQETYAAKLVAANAADEEKTIAQMRSGRDKTKGRFWEDLAHTPQQAFDAYGNRAWPLLFVKDAKFSAFLNSLCLRDDGTPNPELAPRMITDGIPDTYVLTPVADGVVTDDNPDGYGSVTVRPKLVVVAPAGAAVVINGQTVTADDSGRAVFVLPEGPYAGQATLEGYEGGAFTVTLRRGGDRVESGLTLIPPPAEEGGGE